MNGIEDVWAFKVGRSPRISKLSCMKRSLVFGTANDFEIIKGERVTSCRREMVINCVRSIVNFLT